MAFGIPDPEDTGGSGDPKWLKIVTYATVFEPREFLLQIRL